MSSVEIKRGPKQNNAVHQVTRNLVTLALIHHASEYPARDSESVAAEGGGHDPVAYRLEANIHLLLGSTDLVAPPSITFALPWSSSEGAIAHSGASCNVRYRFTTSRTIKPRELDFEGGDREE